MMKYIFCIMIGLFLTAGFTLVFDQNRQEFRTETGTVDLSASISSTDYVSQAIIQPSCEEDHSIKEGLFNFKTSDIVAGNSFSSRNLPPAKTLRFNAASLVIQKLSALKSPLPEVRWAGLFFYTHLCKYSNRYYLYTLGRILI